MRTLVGGSQTPDSDSLLTEGTQHGGSADAEADYCSQRGEQQEVRAKMEKVGEDGGQGEDKSKHIEPERGADGQIFAETEFEQESGQSNGSDDDKSERAEKRGTAGVDYHQSECDQQQTCGNNAPAAGLGRAGRIGSGVGQGVPSLIQGRGRSFQMGWVSGFLTLCVNLCPL